MKLENVVGLVGGASALAGCLLPFTRGAGAAAPLVALHAGGIGMALCVVAALGLAASLLGLLGTWRREESVQVLAGIAGLIGTFLLHRQTAGVGAWGMQLLYWGFAMLLAEGVIHFGERPRADVAR